MPIERAVFRPPSWQVYWTAPGETAGLPDPAPVASFTAAQQKPSGNVLFDGSASSEVNATIVNWSWDFGDGSAVVSSSSPTTSHSYSRSGTYSVTLTVTDNEGERASVSHTLAVSLSVAPIASFTKSPTSFSVAVNAAASSSGNGSIVSYAWNFGDGATGSGITTTHTYSGGGTYTITLVVTDSLGVTATTSQAISLSSVPVALFKSTVVGSSVSVDATPTIAPNPISSYTWTWGENVNVPVYGYGSSAAPITRAVSLKPTSSPNVLQCIVQSNVTNEFYMSQATDINNPIDSTRITRLGTDGAQIDSSKFTNAGHGTSIALEDNGGKVYVWMSWQEGTDGASEANDIVRFPWPPAGTYTRASPPPGMKVMYAKGYDPGYRTDVQFDAKFDRAVIRSSHSTFNTFTQVDLSDFLAGKITVLNNFTIPVGPPTLQGYCTVNESIFILLGVSYTQTAGTPATSATDPPILKQYRWADGSLVNSYDPSVWDRPYESGHYEAESLSVHVSEAGFPHILFGWITGANPSYNYNIYQIPLDTQSLSVAAPSSTGKTASHTYASTGTYQVGLTVKDTTGLSDSVSNPISIGATPVTNQPPIASFTYAPGTGSTYNHVSFDASGSTDLDGTIVRYDWDFTQSTLTTTNPKVPDYVYNAPGTYQVRLTVTDNMGATGITTTWVTISSTPTSNKPPVADFTFTIAGDAAHTWNRVDFTAATSTDADGTIARYDWDFQQSTFSSTSPAAGNYVYNAGGTYSVKLTVTDDKGATASVTKQVIVTAPIVDKPPVANFTWTATNLRVDFDASTSTDADGTIVKYDWDFQQSTFSSTSPTASNYTYNTAGTYTVKLTVTDDKGLTGTTSKQVTVTAPVVVTPTPPPVTSGGAQKSPWTKGSPTEGFPSNVAVYKARTLQPSGTLELQTLINAMPGTGVIDISGQQVYISSWNGGNLSCVNGGSKFLGLLGGISNGQFDNAVIVRPNIIPAAIITNIQNAKTGTSQYSMIKTATAISGSKPVYFMGVHFIGADQGRVTGGQQVSPTPAIYKGIDMDLATAGSLFQNCLIQGFNCANGSTPPWEVGMVDSRRSHGFTVRRVEMDGMLPVGSLSRPTSSTTDPFGLSWRRSGGFQYNADANTISQDFSIHDGLVSGLTYSIAGTSNNNLGPTGNNSGNITLNNLYVENQSQHGFSGVNLEDVMGYVRMDHPTIKMNGSGGNHIGFNNRLQGVIAPVISSSNFVITEPTWSGGPAGAMFSIRIAGNTQWSSPPTVIKNGVKLIGSTGTNLDPTKYYHLNNVS